MSKGIRKRAAGASNDDLAQNLSESKDVAAVRRGQVQGRRHDSTSTNIASTIADAWHLALQQVSAMVGNATGRMYAVACLIRLGRFCAWHESISGALLWTSELSFPNSKPTCDIIQKAAKLGRLDLNRVTEGFDADV